MTGHVTSMRQAPRVTRTETVAREPGEGLAHLFDLELDDVAPDGALPPLWHTVYLLERPRQSDLGPDGHPYHGLPPSPGASARRMFAGGRVSFTTPLRIGADATRTSEVVARAEKQGRSGPLTFVTVRHRIDQDGPVVEAEDDIVYRPSDASSRIRRPVEPNVPPGTDLWGLTVDATLLFRFSALTYNAHRIHYDREWCAKEGYAGLVVHGPLQVLLIAEALRREGTSLWGRRLDYRLVSPLVGEQDVTVRRGDDGRLVVVGRERVVTAEATIRALDDGR